jgi:hypothetical protein
MWQALDGVLPYNAARDENDLMKSQPHNPVCAVANKEN